MVQLNLARGLFDRLVVSKRNRAIQMNAGARAARGDILWFVHVDAKVPWGCLEEIERIMDDPNVAGGFFRIRLPQDPRLSIDGQLCALRRDFAANAVWRSRNILPAHCLSGHRRISRSASNGGRGIFSPASAARSRDMQPKTDPGKPAAL